MTLTAPRVLLVGWLLLLVNGWCTAQPAGEVGAEGKPPLAPALFETGKRLYEKQCAACHGTEGKGDGPAAGFLSPRPRDFTSGTFKIRSTLTLPTDEDLYRTITKGIPGTLMPSFSHLSEKERRALVAYTKSFSAEFGGERPLERVEIPDPAPRTDELLALGEQSYRDAGCFSCHGSEGRGDGPAAATLKDDWGNPIVPYDFTIPGRMKGGSEVQDVFRTIKAGIGGTPMPSYGESLTDEQHWALAYYVLSLTSEAPSEVASGNSVIGKDLFTGSIRFQNGGPSCIACHSVAGIGALGGGTLGPDLSPVSTKFGRDGIRAILTDLPFPTMNNVVSRTPLTQEEQTHLISFFQAAAVTQRPGQESGRLALLALGVAAALLALARLLWRQRLRDVRRPMVARSAGRASGSSTGGDL